MGVVFKLYLKKLDQAKQMQKGERKNAQKGIMYEALINPSLCHECVDQPTLQLEMRASPTKTTSTRIGGFIVDEGLPEEEK